VAVIISWLLLPLLVGGQADGLLLLTCWHYIQLQAIHKKTSLLWLLAPTAMLNVMSVVSVRCCRLHLAAAPGVVALVPDGADGAAGTAAGAASDQLLPTLRRSCQLMMKTRAV